MTRRVAIALLALAALAACQQASEEVDAKQMPRPPPPPEPEIPDSVSVTVTIDGREDAAIDAARLRAATPDFSDKDRRAWDLVKLLGEPARRAGVRLAASGASGPEVVMEPGQDRVPVLVMSRRGDLVATMIDPKEPFPEFHGHGGRKGRRGDPIPRVEGVKKLRVFLSER